MQDIFLQTVFIVTGAEMHYPLLDIISTGFESYNPPATVEILFYALVIQAAQTAVEASPASVYL